MFAQKREQAKLGRVTSVAQKKQEDILPAAKEVPEVATSASKESERTPVNQVLLDEIQENILGDVKGSRMNPSSLGNVLGELVERTGGTTRPAHQNTKPVS